MPSQIILSTPRLQLRTMDYKDAAFYLRLVNDPSFIHNIRDKGIRSLEDAIKAIQTGHQDVQEKMGFSLYLVELKSDQQAIGLCGLVKRPELENIDIGYAYLPEFTGQGYAFEAGKAVVQFAQNTLRLDKLVAITSLHNTASENLLLKMGFQITATIPWNDGSEVKFYSMTLN
ncbi:GNAT family N-acetyltransferase [Undibacterium sp. Di24W]|uniref:GNAT family N-acetyltransferase n=1 Tax=Undibacterium sp. Di24W TaxID=3413033 RepID=UPI003BF017BA